MRAGPLIISAGVAQQVVVLSAYRLKRGSQTARTAATTAGKQAGGQPAITALTAIFSVVASPRRGSTTPITASGASSTVSSSACTRSAVGGISGSPSPQPRASAKAKNSSASAGAACESDVSVPRMQQIAITHR